MAAQSKSAKMNAGKTTPNAGKVNDGRRNLLIGAGAVAIVAAGGIAYFARQGSSVDSEPFTAADLLVPGPLPDQVQGAANAPVTMIEYASMTCPHCAHFHLTTYPELKKRYIDTGKVRYIFREFPLDRLALAGSLLARCAGDGDKYFGMVELLFSHQDKWVMRDSVPPLMALAKQAGFTQQTFEACLQDQAMTAKIEQVREQATKRFKVESTPTFFINGTKVAGALSIEEFAKKIDPLLPTA